MYQQSHLEEFSFNLYLIYASSSWWSHTPSVQWLFRVFVSLVSLQQHRDGEKKTHRFENERVKVHAFFISETDIMARHLPGVLGRINRVQYAMALCEAWGGANARTGGPELHIEGL